MKVAVIITTYNWPGALNLCLSSLLNQSHPPSQVIICDDGSKSFTKDLIDSWRQKLPILHEWQNDFGFRASRCRNLGLRKVTCTYVVCIDGDMVLDHHFIADHVAFAKKGYFVQGSRVLLNDEFSKKSIKEGHEWRWNNKSITNGTLGNRKNLIRKPWLTKLLGCFSHRSAKNTRTCNMAFWKDDLFMVNGFDNRYEGWGREDSDLAWRLINFGLKRRKIKFSAVALHLFHPEVSRQSLPENDAMLKKVFDNKNYFRCKNGIEEDNA